MDILIGGTGFVREDGDDCASPIRILDDLNSIRDLIKIGFMAAASMQDKGECDAIQTTLMIAEQFAADLYFRIDAARESSDEAEVSA